jgi:diguanylate cyclase (GGDEF)-like protein/PAS domain S-box-containing protein
MRNRVDRRIVPAPEACSATRHPAMQERRRVTNQLVHEGPPRRHAAAGGRMDDDLLRQFVDATDALVCIVDVEGRILLANRALQRFLGRTAEELQGELFCQAVVAPEHVILAEDAVERAMASGVAQPQECDWLTGDGERRRVSLRNTVLTDDEGLPYALACVGLDVTADRRREALLHQRAQTDLLTGIANRGALFEALNRRIEDGTGCALLFCDLDKFKVINDEHGHAVGDRILSGVAVRLTGLAGPADLVARFGGDEFVILAGDPDEGMIGDLVQRVGVEVRRPFPGPEGALSLGVSVGVAIWRAGESADDLIGRADRAMYGAKTHHRRRVVR